MGMKIEFIGTKGMLPSNCDKENVRKCHQKPGLCARLNKALQGVRDASQCWEYMIPSCRLPAPPPNGMASVLECVATRLFFFVDVLLLRCGISQTKRKKSMGKAPHCTPFGRFGGAFGVLGAPWGRLRVWNQKRPQGLEFVRGALGRDRNPSGALWMTFGYFLCAFWPKHEFFLFLT